MVRVAVLCCCCSRWPRCYLLDIERREGDCLPEVASVLAGDPEVLVPFLLNDRVVLDRQSVPHHLVATLQVRADVLA